MIGLIALFTVGATHDYLSWNRASWQALHHLTRVQRIPHTQIDGGFEFNGWYGFDPDHETDWSSIDMSLWSEMKSWWWVEDDEYIIAFGQIAGYQEIAVYPYPRWMPFGEGHVRVLQQVSDASTS